MKNNIIFYTHMDSGNHGCEAIAKSTCDIWNIEKTEKKAYFFSNDVEKDSVCGIERYGELVKIAKPEGLHPFSSIIPRVLRRLKVDRNAVFKYKYKKYFGLFDKKTVAVSTGGDLYCYGSREVLPYLNSMIKRRGAVSVLWGCSIEDKVLNPEIIADLKEYDLITARESMTVENLRKAGIEKNVRLFPDPAFILKKEKVKEFSWVESKKVIGINLSSHIIKDDKQCDKFRELIRYILKTTDLSVLLIPHVFWANENDVETMEKVYSVFQKEERVELIKREYTCNEFKYIISKCDMFMGARTHSVIAAYSSCVPSVALSYSVKSIGIARDIFGIEEKYVKKVNEDIEVNELYAIFDYLNSNQRDIKQYLENFMPEYINRITQEKEFIKEWLKSC